MDTSVTYPMSAQKSGSLGIPAFVYATVFASFSIIVGLIWDISWHMSVGRDGLFSAPHLAMYAGAIVSGVFSGYQVLKTTIAGSVQEKKHSVRFWGIFYGTLGALFCIWGAIAMLTSAPFDDWWHNTYGLDITILSPPHTLLLLGMVGIQFGAMVSVLSMQNAGSGQFSASRGTVLKWIYALTTGFFLTMVCTILSEYQGRHDMHRPIFYIVSAIMYPLLLSAFSRSSVTRWGATQAALVYFVFQILMNWVLPLFPAEPKLGPILNPIDSFQSWEFPLLLFIPAMIIDYFNHSPKISNDWLKALVIAPLFILVHLLVQWYVGEFLMTEYARNWVFGQETWYFGANPDWEYRYAYAPWMEPPIAEMLKGLGIAIVVSVLTARVGLYWGNWMKKVKR